MADSDIPRFENVPKDLRGLRACKLCSLIKTYEQFMSNGCENCDVLLKMKSHDLAVKDYTSTTFDGIISMMSPNDSWVSKWQHIKKFVPGCYAISVTGDLPTMKVEELKDKGVNYRSRDNSIK